MVDSPLMGLDGEILGAVEHHLGDLGVLGIGRVRELEKHAEGEEGSLDGLNRRPAGAKSVEADGALDES